jgi:hypothetical protein
VPTSLCTTSQPREFSEADNFTERAGGGLFAREKKERGNCCDGCHNQDNLGGEEEAVEGDDDLTRATAATGPKDSLCRLSKDTTTSYFYMNPKLQLETGVPKGTSKGPPKGPPKGSAHATVVFAEKLGTGANLQGIPSGQSDSYR